LEISKGVDQFQFRQYIPTGMADVHGRIVGAKHFRGLTLEALAVQLGRTIGDVNHVHPFREGNGRTQLQFAQQLAEKAGYRLDLTHLKGPAWIEASREANKARYDAMARCFKEALSDRVRAQRSEGRTHTKGDGDRER
jgi:cell filamentation protein